MTENNIDRSRAARYSTLHSHYTNKSDQRLRCNPYRPERSQCHLLMETITLHFCCIIYIYCLGFLLAVEKSQLRIRTLYVVGNSTIVILLSYNTRSHAEKCVN